MHAEVGGTRAKDKARTKGRYYGPFGRSASLNLSPSDGLRVYNPVHFSVHIIRWRVTVIIHMQYMYCTTRLIHFKIVAYCCALAPWLSSWTVVMPSLIRSGLG